MRALVPLMIALAVAALGYCIYAARKRRQELSRWARAKGLTFRPGKDRRIAYRFEEFKCLRQGHSRYAYNVMAGKWADRSAIAFDYHYATGSGKNRHDHHFSVAILQSPIPLKPLHIRREEFFDKVTEFFGFDDIDFESAEFSRKFHVSSPDKRWAYDVISQPMMDYLLRAPEFSVQFASAHIIAWRSRRFSPADFEKAVELIHGMLDRLPSYLVRQQTRLA